VPWVMQELVARGALSATPGHNLIAVGHRVVHGGAVFHDSVRIDAKVKQTLAELSALAPLHNPPALAAIEAAERALPHVPQVAVFDTAFFAKLPPSAFVYPLPYEWYTDWGVRRFGFHGISHAYCASRAAEMLGRDLASLRLIICHLGNGCSASAVRGGAPVATSMGFTPLDGLMMGTRCGSVDPSILVHALRNKGVSADALDHALNHASGLLGVSGVSSDLREVEKAADAGNERARLALTIFADRVRQTIGAYAATMGGVDALVFTAGIGEHSARIRAAACDGLSCLGLHIDAGRNGSCRADADIATVDSPGRILVLHTREEWLIARETVRILDGPSAA
jgi:acetate kinase